MKKHLALLFSGIGMLYLLILPGCMNSDSNSEVIKLKEENRELKRERAEAHANLHELTSTINFIQANLDTIKHQEQIISTIASNDIENQPDAKDRITNDISSIYNKLIANRRKLSELNNQLKNNNNQNKDLKELLERMDKQMDEKIIEIEHLRNQLERMQGKIFSLEGLVDTLNSLRKQQETIIAYQQEEMNTVYYAYGTQKELREANVITKEGGLLGIGKARKLKDDLNKDYFTAINKYKLKSLTLNAKKIRIVTPHPEGSYKLHGEKPIDSIEITDPVKFWSNTQFLVIEIK
jgi:chromosome segregation ATPase